MLLNFVWLSFITTYFEPLRLTSKRPFSFSGSGCGSGSGRGSGSVRLSGRKCE